MLAAAAASVGSAACLHVLCCVVVAARQVPAACVHVPRCGAGQVAMAKGLMWWLAMGGRFIAC